MRMSRLFGALWAVVCGGHLYANDLPGTWQSECTVEDGQSAYSESLGFTDSDFSIRISSFEEGDCGRELLQFFAVGSYVTSPSDPETQMAVDYTFMQIDMIPKDKAVADYLNDSNFCGFQDWAVDEAKEVTGTLCPDLGQMPEEGEMHYSIAKVEAQTLYLGLGGDDLDGSTPEKRPTELDTDLPYTKQ